MKRGESLIWTTSIIDRRFLRLNPRPEYQRESVWTRPQKQLLIDSIIRNMDIPKLYFRELAKGDGFDYEVIDGQQRLTAVYEFRQGKFPLSPTYTPEYGGLTYAELPEDIKDRIDLYQLHITVINEASDEEIRDMFCRLQNGTPLNAAEKRNAMTGNMRDFIDDLARTHEVFKAYQRGNRRFAHDQMAAQVTLLEIVGGPTSVKNAQLNEMYARYQDFDSNGPVALRIKRVLNYLARAFREPTPEFSGRAQFVSLYMLVSHTLNEYAMVGRESQLREFFIDFEARRRLDTDNIEMVQYNAALARTSDGREQIAYRHQILLREWLLYAQDLELKDPQRLFSREQRLAIYRKDHEICQICGEHVEWADFDADHIVPHAHGGKTTVSNGATTHRWCNQAKGMTAN